MKKVLMIAAISMAFAAPASAQVIDNVGECMSDGFYGNQPNIVDPYAPGGPQDQEPGTKGGRVVPSQSPGPQVTNDDGSVSVGSSVGDYHQEFGGGVIPEVCRTFFG